jgi:hypothetical protein
LQVIFDEPKTANKLLIFPPSRVVYSSTHPSLLDRVLFIRMPPSCNRSEPEDHQGDNEFTDMHQQETGEDSTTNRTASMLNDSTNPRLRLPMRPIERQRTREGDDHVISRRNASAHREWVCALLQVALDVANDPMLDDDDDDVDNGLVRGGSESDEVSRQ